FMRLYLIPAGAPPGAGAYLTYPWHDLLAILALESHRNRCLVIGEDLGTVPAGLRDDLAAAGVLSTRVFYFERTDAGFAAPAGYPAEAMVTVGTHDLPTFAGFWTGADLQLRSELDLWPTPQDLGRELARREPDREAVAAFAGVAPTQPEPP